MKRNNTNRLWSKESHYFRKVLERAIKPEKVNKLLNFINQCNWSWSVLSRKVERRQVRTVHRCELRSVLNCTAKQCIIMALLMNRTAAKRQQLA